MRSRPAGPARPPELASPGVAPPVAPDDEFLESTETVRSHPGGEVWALERDAEVGDEVGGVTDLALCPEGFRGGAVARAMTSRTVSMCGPLKRARKNQSSAGSPKRAHSKSSSAVTL